MEDAKEQIENNASEKPMECSDVEEESVKTDAPACVRICVLGSLGKDEAIVKAAQSFGVTVEVCEDGLQWLQNNSSGEHSTIFVLEEFSGLLFDTLKGRHERILGPTALQELAGQKKALPELHRPLYSLAMSGVIVCFTGFRKKLEIERLMDLIHHMGGSIRRDMVSKVTHLIANRCGGEKYQYAATFKVPIVSSSWVHDSWAMRGQIGFSAHHHALTEHRLKPFNFARVCFWGFPDEERQHMTEVLIENGGISTDIDDPACTHVVLDCPDGLDNTSGGGLGHLNKRRRLDSTVDSQVVTPTTSLSPSPTHDNSFSLPTSTSTPRRSSASIASPLNNRLSLVRRSLRLHNNPVTKWISSLEHVVGGGYHLRSLQPPSQTPVTPDTWKSERDRILSVVDESTTSVAPPQKPTNALMVKAEWFWASVQNEVCVDEKDHEFQETNSTPRLSLSSTPSSSSRLRKRKRLRANLSRVISPQCQDKRRSSVTDATLLSCSGSFLDSSPHVPESETEVSETPNLKSLSARHQVFLELFQTESNYVGILNTIMTLFKVPLEEMLEEEDQLLNATELKIIFGNLPPIYQTHCQMLEELRYAAKNWSTEVSIGNIFLKFAPDLIKAYPPFVNFFETTREMLVKCDETKPRFHAFLKARQTRPECGRQTLVELLIRPVQRLPSVSLLLSDILKHTNKSNPDHSALDKALSSIREVMTHINEDKRRTEGQMVMFDIFNDIDNCPAHLVSSHRSFITRCEVMELSEGLSGRGDSLVLYLFTDVLEVCKKRSKAFNSLKSPSSTGLGKLATCKPYKHIKLISLATIRRVFDIIETELCHNVFALMCRSTEDLKEKLYSFTITDDEVEKTSFLKTLCRQTANQACRPDAENFLATLDPKNLDIETSDVGLGTLGKAFKFASRTRMKVGRAFSFNKTPSKLKRAVSTMMSPFGSTNNLTPATQLAQMRLASCTNISELVNGSPPVPQYVAPLSVQPTRRSKHSSLSVASLRRL